MKIFAQGHQTNEANSPVAIPRVRRSVALGSLATLIVGASVAFALPSFATVALPSAPTVTHHRAIVSNTHAARRIASTTTTTIARKVVSTTTTVTSVVTRTVVATISPRVVTSRIVTPRVATPATVAAAAVATPTSPVALKLSANIAPQPNFLVSGTGTYVNGVATYQNPCITPQSTWPSYTNDPACTDFILQAINHARSVEGLAAMVLPSNWYTLTTPQQLFVLANLERTARGLPPYVGLNVTLSAEAQRAAQTNSDPGLAPGFSVGLDAQGVPGMGGAWGAGFNVLATDYVWMYMDGWAGSVQATSNIACTSPSAPGCWAHREEMLGSAPNFNPGVGLLATNAVMGTGFAMVNGHASLVDLIELPKGALPPLTFSWAGEASFLG